MYVQRPQRVPWLATQAAQAATGSAMLDLASAEPPLLCTPPVPAGPYQRVDQDRGKRGAAGAAWQGRSCTHVVQRGRAVAALMLHVACKLAAASSWLLGCCLQRHTGTVRPVGATEGLHAAVSQWLL